MISERVTCSSAESLCYRPRPKGPPNGFPLAPPLLADPTSGSQYQLRRGTVSKECIHIALGITPEGQKAVLGYEIIPNENNASWSTLLDKLQNQGIQQVSLVVTDGFKGLEQVISQAYPLAKQ